jgi:superfamily II DNA helicase RecQ
MMTKFLRGSKDTKIVEWNMHKRENFWALEDLTSELIQAVIEALISKNYLYKTEWKYPLLSITEIWKVAIVRNFLLKDDNTELQHYIKIRLWSNPNYKKKKESKNKAEKWNNLSKLDNSDKLNKTDTFEETFQLLKEWKSLSEIWKERNLKPITIESHIVRLYEVWKIGLKDIMKYSNFANLKIIKSVIIDENNWKKDISYFEIKIAIAMMEKKDL